jgi:hypothetical protein
MFNTMRYYKKAQKIIEESELRGIQCNRCEEVFEPYDELVQPFNLPLHNEYGQINFDLCENCLLEIIKELKIVPNGFKSDSGFTSSFDLDHGLHQQLFDEWKRTGIWNNDENPYRDAWINRENTDNKKINKLANFESWLNSALK